MSIYRHNLPQLNDDLFLTDGGLETTLVFLQNIELPHFAAFDLLSVEHGRQRLRNYYAEYLRFAVENQQNFVLESPTWRANPDWATRLGYSRQELIDINVAAIELMVELRKQYSSASTKIVISGCVGPRGDGYVPQLSMSPLEARDYHALQINTFADTHADMVSAMTMNYTDEAIGIVMAAKDANLPVIISFTTETDGHLPTGQSLREAIESVDEATDNGPAYYMINCAHPDHFKNALEGNSRWVSRVRSIRANASRKSHAELDEATSLDRGNPTEFGAQYNELRRLFPQLSVLGGCCGTDLEHIKSVQQHCCHS
jgi:S-methylmethionine-dependent homocysteine/selenocysteine methylase